MPEEALIEESVFIGSNSILWSERPILMNITGQSYHGRIFVEVWEDDMHLAFTNHCRKDFLKEKTIDALRSQQFILVDSEQLTDEPVTGPSSETFIGRVTIEIWDNPAVANITGQKRELLLYQARRMLEVKELWIDETLVPQQK